MLDKDFDAFFKSSLEDYEITPTKDTWSKISDKIAPKTTRKKFPVFWIAAASIIIVLGVGVGLYNKPTDVIKLHPDGQNEMMANLAEAQQTKSNSIVTKDEVMGDNLKKSVSKSTTFSEPTKANSSTEVVLVKESISVDQPVTIEIAAVRSPKTVRPKLATGQLLAQQEITRLKKIEAVTLDENQHAFIASAGVDKTTSVKKVKISSMGDLVNFVVAKVDKREEKIIKISRTAESDNEVTGINLGLFKFTKLD